uniref:Uncharacterized protein n=1 Tax=Alexandrium monilatum TaxID=311494 RepID=A0A7S4WEF5_9DINO
MPRVAGAAGLGPGPAGLPGVLLDSLSDCDTFCVVRDPGGPTGHRVDRMVSEWKWAWMWAAHPVLDWRCTTEEFHAWALRYEEKMREPAVGLGCHRTAQAEFVFSRKTGQRVCRHVLRMENLSAELDELLGEYNLTRPPLKPSTPPPCRIEVPPDVRDMVGRIYPDDFAAFGYEVHPAGLTPPPPRVVDQLRASSVEPEERVRGVMHTFFQPLQKNRLANQTKLLQVWEEAWKAVGWETRVLTLADARRHAEFEAFSARVWQVPLGINPEYDYLCYMRYMAMEAAGGGWMSDMDVLPVSMPRGLGLPHAGRFTVYLSCIPSFVSASAAEWRRMRELMVDVGSAKRKTWTKLFSDMHALKELRERAEVPYVPMWLVADGSKFARRMNRSDVVCTAWADVLAVHMSHNALKKLGLRGGHVRVVVMNLTFHLWRQHCA